MVAQAWVADPAAPTTAPSAHRYPFAGTANAEVELHLLDVAGAAGAAPRMRRPPQPSATRNGKPPMHKVVITDFIADNNKLGKAITDHYLT